MSEYIVGILKPSNKESRTDITEGLVLDAELLDHVFKVPITTIKCTSCKRDGLRAQHILDALCGEGSATATDLLLVITLVVNLWLVGRCPPILSEFLASALPTPLLKPDNGI
nr:putative reverse transcriptase domain-containing protein [Tanacetum cinerariifolium]